MERRFALKIKLNFSPVLATYDSDLGEIYIQLGIFLVNVMRLLLLRFLQPPITATRDELFGKMVCRITFWGKKEYDKLPTTCPGLSPFPSHKLSSLVAILRR